LDFHHLAFLSATLTGCRLADITEKKASAHAYFFQLTKLEKGVKKKWRSVFSTPNPLIDMTKSFNILQFIIARK